ncbi:MAG TPA: hypothetical protein VGK67_22550 [Myxococcales bacterium]|jgi:hypothetical protein
MKKGLEILRQTAAVLLGVGLVFGGVEMGSGGSGLPRAQAQAVPAAFWAPGEMPAYPGMEYPLGDGLAVNGLPLRVSYFEAKATPEDVRDFYVRELEGRGLEVGVKYGVAHGFDVTALSEDGRAEIAVAIMLSGTKGKVLVFPSIIPLDARPDSVEGLTGELPLPKTVVGLMVVTAKDKQGEAVATYQVPLESPQATAANVRDEMGRRGWSLKQFEKAPDGGTVIEVSKETRRIHFTVLPWPVRQQGAGVTAVFSGFAQGAQP